MDWRLVLLTACLGLVPSAMRAQEAAAGAWVTVTVDSTGVAHVRERYRLPRDTAAFRWRVLLRPCATIDSVRLDRYDRTLQLASEPNGPWLEFRDTTGVGYNTDSSGLDLNYRVQLSAAIGDVPLVHLARPIPRMEGEREGGVYLVVQMASGKSASMTFPYARRSGATNEWVARYVAIPSFVRVRADPSPAQKPCEQESVASRDDGGLSWRFWTLLTIMVAWVPLYLAWARRAEENGE